MKPAAKAKFNTKAEGKPITVAAIIGIIGISV